MSNLSKNPHNLHISKKHVKKVDISKVEAAIGENKKEYIQATDKVRLINWRAMYQNELRDYIRKCLGIEE